ncbi:MAG TPA: glycosyltransferase family A protein, partial [Allocoleopsis sp.]
MVQPKQALSVSVIVPVYNAERYLSAALSSILKEQDVALDVIVVNDGSTDGSLNEVRKFADPRIRWVDNLGKGIADALNTGLAAARGQFVVRCDADDLYPANRIA